MDYKMNSVDSMARDIAMECILGGDRFDPQDVADMLGPVSRTEAELLKKRIAYHAEDFAPPEFRPKEFLDKEIAAWTGALSVREDDFSIRPAYSEMTAREDRGKWFRFSDGKIRRCEKAVASAMWPERSLGSENLPERISSLEAAEYKADALISSYGSEIERDDKYEYMDVKSYGSSAEGSFMKIYRNVDILAEHPLQHLFLLESDHPEGKPIVTFDSLPDGELDRLCGILDTELSVRKGLSLMHGLDSLPESAMLALPKGTIVRSPEQMPFGNTFSVSALFVGPDGSSFVSGTYFGDLSGQEYNYRLSEFSDVGIATIKESTGIAMAKVMSKMRDVAPKEKAEGLKR